MVLLLNFIPTLILLAWLIAIYQSYKRKSWSFFKWASIATLALTMLYVAAQPSYFPKGQPQRTQLEQFEAEELEMQDRLRKNELSPAERGEHINSRLDAIDKLNKRKEEQQ